MKTLLFDIDGTLILSGGAGRLALLRTLETDFEIHNPVEVPLHGQTDRGIAAELFERNGIENSENNWYRFRESYLKNLELELPRCQGSILPGVSDLLGYLAQVPQVRLGLLTGNVQQGAALKLGHYGLFHFFHFGGFGDHHADRNDVARQAKVAAQQASETRLVDDDLWVIGDTPNDIRCGRAINARVLAVATGGSSRDTLAAEGPDLLLDDLHDCQLWLNELQLPRDHPIR